MKTVIVYASQYGCTERCAQLLQERLGDGVTLVNVAKTPTVDLTDYDCVAVGGSIYAGKIQPTVTKFCLDHMDVLMQKKVGLFLCCANGDQFETQIKAGFDSRLLEHAVAREHFGHEFKLEKMSLPIRLVVRAVAKVTKSESKIRVDNIQKLAEALQ